MQEPIVTIGLPTFNAATTLKRAIDSILNQTYSRWVLCISDDFSTDGTVDIISGFAIRFPEKIKVLEPTEKRYYMNFRHLLNAAQTPYFVWLAGDDWWEPSFLEDCIGVLESDPGAVCCVGRCLFHNPDGSSFLDHGCQPLLGDTTERMSSYLHAPDQTRMYGVFRRNVLIESFPPTPFHAYDWALCLGTLRFGTHRTVNKQLINREKTPPRSYIESVKKDEPNLFYRLFPILRMTLWSIKNRIAIMNAVVFIALLRLNVIKHERQVQALSPRVFRVLRPAYSLLRKSISFMQSLAWKFKHRQKSDT